MAQEVETLGPCAEVPFPLLHSPRRVITNLSPENLFLSVSAGKPAGARLGSPLLSDARHRLGVRLRLRSAFTGTRGAQHVHVLVCAPGGCGRGVDRALVDHESLSVPTGLPARVVWMRGRAGFSSSGGISDQHARSFPRGQKRWGTAERCSE